MMIENLPQLAVSGIYQVFVVFFDTALAPENLPYLTMAIIGLSAVWLFLKISRG
jgi:hypothetical protein